MLDVKKITKWPSWGEFENKNVEANNISPNKTVYVGESVRMRVTIALLLH